MGDLRNSPKSVLVYCHPGTLSLSSSPDFTVDLSCFESQGAWATFTMWPRLSNPFLDNVHLLGDKVHQTSEHTGRITPGSAPDILALFLNHTNWGVKHRCTSEQAQEL